MKPLPCYQQYSVVVCGSEIRIRKIFQDPNQNFLLCCVKISRKSVS